MSDAEEKQAVVDWVKENLGPMAAKELERADTVLKAAQVPLVYYDKDGRHVIGRAKVVGDVFTGEIDPEIGGESFAYALREGQFKGLRFTGGWLDEASLFGRPDVIKIEGRIPGLFGIPQHIPAVMPERNRNAIVTESCDVSESDETHQVYCEIRDEHDKHLHYKLYGF